MTNHNKIQFFIKDVVTRRDILIVLIKMLQHNTHTKQWELATVWKWSKKLNVLNIKEAFQKPYPV